MQSHSVRRTEMLLYIHIFKHTWIHRFFLDALVWKYIYQQIESILCVWSLAVTAGTGSSSAWILKKIFFEINWQYIYIYIYIWVPWPLSFLWYMVGLKQLFSEKFQYSFIVKAWNKLNYINLDRENCLDLRVLTNNTLQQPISESNQGTYTYIYIYI